MSVSKTILLGNLGSDPEIRTFDNGNKVANFSLATSESYTDKSTGEKKTITDCLKLKQTLLEIGCNFCSYKTLIGDTVTVSTDVKNMDFEFDENGKFLRII